MVQLEGREWLLGGSQVPYLDVFVCGSTDKLLGGEELYLFNVVGVSRWDLNRSFVCAVLHVVVPETGVIRTTSEVPLIRRERERVHSVLTLSITP